jgi:hypothetical protein
VEEGLWDVLCISPPGTPFLYSGEGCTLTPPPRHQKATTKEEEKGGGVQGWGRPHPPPPSQKPLLWPAWARPMAPPFFLYSLMGFFQ